MSELGKDAQRSFNQMGSAPQNAFYVWCREDLDLARRLAVGADRRDLNLISPNQLLTAHRNYAGMIISGLVLDQSAVLTRAQAEGFAFMKTLVRR